MSTESRRATCAARVDALVFRAATVGELEAVIIATPDFEIGAV
jgi:hypothetical protein